MNPRKLTEAQIRRIREVAALRKTIPTNAELALEMGCSKCLVDMFAAGHEYKNAEHRTKLDEAFLELGLAKP